MKRFFFLVLALAVCAFTFVSCNKEKDKDNSSESVYAQAIVGTWHYDRYWDEEDQMWYGGEDLEDVLYIFDTKGFYTQKYVDGGTYRYKYHLEKDIIYIGDEDDRDSEWKNWDESYRISSISSDKMVLLILDALGGKMEFSRVE